MDLIFRLMESGIRDPGNFPGVPIDLLPIRSTMLPYRKGNGSGLVDLDISRNTPTLLIDIQISQVKTSYLFVRYGMMQIIYTSK